MKILIFVNDSKCVMLYWVALLKALRSRGHQIICYVPKTAQKQHVQEIAALGATVGFYPLQRKGLNAAYDVYTLWHVGKILLQQKPQAVFASTIKPVIYTSLAKRLLAKFLPSTHVFACITGLGFAFEEARTTHKKIIQSIAQRLYKIGLAGAKKVFFQNTADAELFMQKKLIAKQKSIVCQGGTGVDTEHFAYVPTYPPTAHFLLMARLLEAKGIREYAAAAKILRQKYPQATFALLGPEEKGFGAISMHEVLQWQSQGIIQYLGAVGDARPHIASTGVMVLPSWREGAPCAILEGMSMGRACIVSQVPGCMDIVQDKEQGLMVPRGHVQSLVKAMEYFILHPEERERMGNKAREHVQKHFEARAAAAFLVRHMEV